MNLAINIVQYEATLKCHWNPVSRAFHQERNYSQEDCTCCYDK